MYEHQPLIKNGCMYNGGFIAAMKNNSIASYKEASKLMHEFTDWAKVTDER